MSAESPRVDVTAAGLLEGECSIACRSTKSSRILAASIAGLVVATLFSTWIRHGFDVTDQGYQLGNQRGAALNSPTYEYSMTWLSDVIGGWWLELAGDPGLLWARAGMSVSAGLIAAMTCWILSRHFRLRACLASVVVASAMLRTNPPGTIDYTTVPSLLLLPAVGLLVEPIGRVLRVPRFALRACVAGALFGLATMAKITIIVVVFMPALLLAIRSCFGCPPRMRDLVAMAVAIGSSFIAIAVCLFILSRMGRLDQYLTVFTGGSGVAQDEAHSFSKLLSVYGRQALQAVSLSLHFLGAVAIACALRAARAGVGTRGGRDWRAILSLLALSSGFYAAAALLGAKSLAAWRDYRVALAAMTILGALVLLGVERYLVPPNLRRRDLAELLVCGLFLGCCGAAGSSTGLWIFKESMWLLLPTVLLMVPRASEYLGRRYPLLHVPPAVMRALSIAIGVAVLLGSQVLSAVSPYRDARSPFARSAQLTHPRLRGILTTPGRARSVNELFVELDHWVGPGDPVVAYDFLYMVYYVTGAVPSLGQIWIDPMNPAVLAQRLSELGKSRPVPRIGVRAKSNMKSPDWGVLTSPELPDVTGQRGLIDGALRGLGFVEVWENADFVILAPRPTSGVR